MSKVVDTRVADENHVVHTLKGKGKSHMKKPCPTCPWRKDAVGEFPAEAFRLSARTCHDMAQSTFACHQAGAENSRICAGFLLSESSYHNMALRLKMMQGKLDLSDVSDGGVELFRTYAEMAIANGVPDDDEALALCR